MNMYGWNKMAESNSGLTEVDKFWIVWLCIVMFCLGGLFSAVLR